ncbi:response regulator [Desulfobotulus sp.]|jgi:DNA-binding NtrC family response regulator|uniref:response regulator n=1 Tax=Desulfobotulus sp. TaxID=1940337 RepID=UPI002A3715B8|nr:response regulator [Desulfobotulus sp.]MDY0162778.1 response regulator [Desulfobotulus sp.]
MKIKAFLVDDEAPFADALAERLSMRNFAVNVAYSGKDCLETITQTPQGTDVVVLDIQMPGISGLDVLKEIKKINPLIQVILLTGQATVEIAIEGMKQGAFDFLMKPTETEDLALKIQDAFAIKAAHQERIRLAEMQNIISHRGW